MSLSNVGEAYEKSTSPEFRREFAWTPEEAARAERWSAFASELTTNMHEVIGHASGRMSERLNGTPQAALKEQYSALEESRAIFATARALRLTPQSRIHPVTAGSRAAGAGAPSIDAILGVRHAD